MKRLILLAATALFSFSAFAQQDTPVVRYLREDIRRAAFNTHSYEFDSVQDTPAPKGYKAFYISHYGRHGSRSDWGGPQYKKVRDLLTKADEQRLLTPDDYGTVALLLSSQATSAKASAAAASPQLNFVNFSFILLLFF